MTYEEYKHSFELMQKVNEDLIQSVRNHTIDEISDMIINQEFCNLCDFPELGCIGCDKEEKICKMLKQMKGAGRNE